MKLKILLLAIFAAGLSASLAFAEDGKPKDTGPKCTPVRVQVEACTLGSQLVVKHVQLQPMKPKPDGSTTGDDHHGDKPKPSSTTTTSGDGEHKGGTTTSPTTTTTP